MICQDRLGTIESIKTKEETNILCGFSAQVGTLHCRHRVVRQPLDDELSQEESGQVCYHCGQTVRKNETPSLSVFNAKNDHSTKTGSGQA